MAEITVVIPNYKGIKFIRECLASLYAQEPDTPAFEVLVVDNASDDGALEIIRMEYPQTRLICLKENTGFCHAVNVGIEGSESPFVILLNNDTKVYPDFIKNLYQSISRKENIFSVSAAMLMWDRPELVDDAGDQYTIMGWVFSRGKGRPYAKYTKACRIFSACGGAVIYRKSLLAETGLFDERHFAYLEDLDLGWRAGIAGYENWYEPSAKVIHYGSASTGSRYNEWKTRRAAANSIYVIYKNMPLLQKLVNLPFLILGFLIKYLFFLKKKMGMLYLKGLMDGFRMSFEKEGRKRKIPFRMKHFTNYLKLEWRMIISIADRL